MSAQAENFLAGMVHAGVLEVREDGSIWRLQSRTRTGRALTIEPVRADYKAAKGYRAVSAHVGGVRYQGMAHRVIWIAQNGPVPEGLEINHKDGVRDNNRQPNLEPLTHGENQKHAYDFLARTRCYGERNGAAKLSDARVALIRAQKGKKSSRQVGADFEVSHRQVLNIWTGKKRATASNGFPS